VLLLDIIEHFKNPETFLDSLRRCAKARRPKVIVTTGNVAFFIVRLQLLMGRFNYGQRGILDLTHSRLYTFNTLRKLFTQCGYKIEKIRGIPAPFPKAMGLNLFSKILLMINDFLICVSKGFFSYQIFMVATPTPTVDAILANSMHISRLRAQEILHEVQ
jgi:hypothetical protein